MILWVISLWDSLDHSTDTTLRIVQEALQNGLTNYICDNSSIQYLETRVVAEVMEVTSIGANREKHEIILGEKTTKEISFFQLVFYRADPPVNYTYIYGLQLLNSASQHNLTKILNPPLYILSSSEKFAQIGIPGIFPKTVITNNWSKLVQFGRTHKTTVLKPLNEAQSRGIEFLRWHTNEDEEENLKKINTLSKGFIRPVLLQEYLAGISEGEIRMWFVNGKLISIVKRFFNLSDLSKVHSTTTIVPITPNAEQKNLVDKISEYLSANHIFLAAVDSIENKVTDFNITSPGLLVEIENATTKNLASIIVQEIKTALIKN